MSNILGYAWLSIGVAAFLMMLVAFARLFRIVWRAPDRWTQIKKVLNLKPRKNQEWPNNTREADVIGCAAGLGVVFFGSLLVLVYAFSR